jgi:hypothetical protein
MLPGAVLYVVGVDAVLSGLSRGEIPWPLIRVAAAAAVILIFTGEDRQASSPAKTGGGSFRPALRWGRYR